MPNGKKREETKETPNKQKEIIPGDVHSIIKINKMILGTGSLKRYFMLSPPSALISQ